MGHELKADLERYEAMVFGRVADCRELIQRFHELATSSEFRVRSSKLGEAGSKFNPESFRGAVQGSKPEGSEFEISDLRFESRNGDARTRTRRRTRTTDGSDYGLLERLYEWVFVPLTLWPVDVRGLGMHVLERIEEGRPVEDGVRLLCSFLPEAPESRTRELVEDYERSIKAGRYEELISAQYKFDSMEEELSRNAEFQADWQRLKEEFEVTKHRNAKGVIRRRMVQERNFRPADWRFSWETEAERFQGVFDAFCHRWDLYGMEGDKPLLMKLTVNLTPYGTLIVVPRYWSFDAKRDLRWNAIARLHRLRGVGRQGPKLRTNALARQEEAKRARRFWREATRKGLKGEKRVEWVMGRLGWDLRTDESKLRRLMSPEARV
jgi:hypothetical protein